MSGCRVCGGGETEKEDRSSVGFVSMPDDERLLMLGTLAFLRDAVIAKTHGLSDDQARWTPDGGLLPLVGIVNHLAHVEWRWTSGALRGEEVRRSEDEFRADGVSLPDAIALYRARAEETDREVLGRADLDEIVVGRWGGERSVRSVLLHLIQETARHAGHADSTRELLDGTKG